MPPAETAEVTLGEVNRNVERLAGVVDRLSQQIADYPKWSDVSRIEQNLIGRISSLEDAAKAAKARTYTALATGATSLAGHVILWLVTGR